MCPVRPGQALQAVLEDALGDVPRVVQWLWTSDQQYCGEGVPPAHHREFCSLLNAALRDDDPELLAAAMPLIRAINSLCVVRGARPEAQLHFPPADCCFRGGGLPDTHLGFFAPGRKYRVQGFLATSFDCEANPAPPLAPAQLSPAYGQALGRISESIRASPRSFVKVCV